MNSSPQQKELIEQVNIHFFPFKTIIKKQIESFDNIQGLYVESYPEFLAQILSSIPNANLFLYVNNIVFNKKTKEEGFSNWSLDTVEYLVKTRGNPTEGFGVTGELFFHDQHNCFVKISVFDVSNKSNIKTGKVKFKLENIFSAAIHSSIKFIIQTCRLETYMKKSLLIHDSILKNPMAFLLFLQIRDMLRKKSILPYVFTEKRILGTFLAAFKEQAEFLVLEIMFQDFVKDLDQSKKDIFKEEIQQIEMLIKSKYDAHGHDILNAKVCLKYGMAYNEEGRFHEAIKEYTKAIELNPGYSDAYYNRAFVYSQKRQQYELVILDFTKVIDMNPKDVDAYYNRAVCHYLKREYDKAWVDIEQVQALGAKIEPKFMKMLLAEKDSPDIPS